MQHQTHIKLLSLVMVALMTVTCTTIIVSEEESDAVTDLGNWNPLDKDGGSPTAAYSYISTNADKIYNSGVRTIYLLQGGGFSIQEWGSDTIFFVGSYDGGFGIQRGPYSDLGDGTRSIYANDIQKLGTLNISFAEDIDGSVNRWELDIIIVGESVTIDSKGGTEATVGYEYEYEVQTTPSDAGISISGADWLSVSGHTISGIPMEAGSYTVTITATLEGYESTTETVVIVVSEEQPVEGAPQIVDFGYTVDPSNPYRVTFVVEEENASSVTIDFGDGTSGSGTKVTHTYDRSGSYIVRAVASNSDGSVTEPLSLLIADRTPDTSVQYNHRYTFTLGIDTDGLTPQVDGCPFLEVTAGSNYVTVTGTPNSTSYVGKTYDVTLTVGEFSMSWKLTVSEGSTVPTAGFTVETDGLTVIVTSTASNADMTFYQWTDGGSFVQSNTGVTKYTYSEPGTYTVTQRVTATVDGQTITDEFSMKVIVDGSSTPEPTPGPEGGSMMFIAGIALAVLGVVALAVGAYTRNYIIAAVAAILIVIGAVLWWMS